MEQQEIRQKISREELALSELGSARTPNRFVAA
jgi:hypothetical protein